MNAPSQASVSAVPPFDLADFIWSYGNTVARTDNLEVAREAARRLMADEFSPAIEGNLVLSEGAYVFRFEQWPGNTAWSPFVVDPQPAQVVTLYYFAPTAEPQHQPRWAVRDTRRLPDESILRVCDTESEATGESSAQDSGPEFGAWESAWVVTPVLHL